jgi:molybdate transport system ATP-binding protein
VCIRAENVVLQRDSGGGARRLDGEGKVSARNHIPGLVRGTRVEGSVVRVEVDCGFSLNALLTRPALEEMEIRPGVAVTAVVKATAVHLLRR